MRVKVIHNPIANRGRARRLRASLEAWGRVWGEIEVQSTEWPGHAAELARRAAGDGFDVVAAAGGDGTVHEVVNGLVENGQAAAHLGVIPLGTGNDLAWSLGIPPDPAAAIAQLFTGRPQPLDLGQITLQDGRQRLFANGLGIGFDAMIAIESTRIQGLKGVPLYVAAALKTILFKYYSPQFTMRFDDDEVSHSVLLLAIGNGRRAGGAFLMTPDADTRDGRVDSCTVRPVSRFYMLRMLLRLTKGTHVTLPPVTMRRHSSVHVTADEPLPIHSDGEIIAALDDAIHAVSITTLPGVITVMGTG